MADKKRGGLMGTNGGPVRLSDKELLRRAALMQGQVDSNMSSLHPTRPGLDKEGSDLADLVAASRDSLGPSESLRGRASELQDLTQASQESLGSSLSERDDAGNALPAWLTETMRTNR